MSSVAGWLFQTLYSHVTISMALNHFAKDRDVIFSIIQHGFVYFHNETKTLLPIVGKFLGIPEEATEPSTNGMVCFTDIPIEQSKKHRRLFGHYGITLSKSWAVSQGAKKVKYLPGNGPVSQRLQKLFNEMCIVPNWGSEEPVEARKMFASTEHMMSLLGNEHTHTQFLKQLEWTQTDEHQSQSEWRIRSSGRSADFIGHIATMGTQKGIKEILGLKVSINRDDGFPPHVKLSMSKSLTLELTDDAVLSFICPKDDLEVFSSVISKTRFSMKPIQSVIRD